MMTAREILFLVFLFLISAQVSLSIPDEEIGSSFPSEFRIIIDGGSTGSRLHLFEFTKATSTLARNGSWAVRIPLTTFSPDPKPKDIANYLLPLFENAAKIIPRAQHTSTQVKYVATAGMRLLTEIEQHAIYDAMFVGLLESPKYSFNSLKRENIMTLSGEDEGFFAAVTANYLDGRVSPSLVLSERPIGALDLGGSSCQIVFSTKKHPVLLKEDFFSKSYLNYGVDRFRERVWNSLVKTCRGCSSVPNPCGFKGYVTSWENSQLVGTGQVEECKKIVKHVLSGLHDPINSYQLRGNAITSSKLPHFEGKFMAMSNFFFSLDALRVLGDNNEKIEEAWPNPSIVELEEALEGLCPRNWQGDMQNQTETHSFTRAEVLPHRCIEAVYIVLLLKEGFKFDSSSRDITFLYDVRGNEVEWTLGMALHNLAKDRIHLENNFKSTDSFDDTVPL